MRGKLNDVRSYTPHQLNAAMDGGAVGAVVAYRSPLRPGENVFVSAAAGAVGSIAGPVARLRGTSRVLGSAGSAAKLGG